MDGVHGLGQWLGPADPPTVPMANARPWNNIGTPATACLSCVLSLWKCTVPWQCAIKFPCFMPCGNCLGQPCVSVSAGSKRLTHLSRRGDLKSASFLFTALCSARPAAPVTRRVTHRPPNIVRPQLRTSRGLKHCTRNSASDDSAPFSVEWWSVASLLLKPCHLHLTLVPLCVHASLAKQSWFLPCVLVPDL